jgi:hypothetical protein
MEVLSIARQDCRYVPDRSWRFEPRIAQDRRDIATFYRYMRRDGKSDLARLLYLTMKSAGDALAKQLAKSVMNGTTEAVHPFLVLAPKRR